MRKIKMVLCSALAVSVVLSGCGNTGDVEKTGESGMQAVETTAEATEISEVLKPEEKETGEMREGGSGPTGADRSEAVRRVNV